MYTESEGEERGVCMMALKKVLKKTPKMHNQHLVRSCYPTKNLSWMLCCNIEMQLIRCIPCSVM